MKFLRRRKPTQLERVLAEHDLTEAMAAVQPPPIRYARVRTRQGRIAHLVHPDEGVLCGWPDANTEADSSLPVCRLCGRYAAGDYGENKAAS